MSSNPRSRGGVFSCVRPYSAVFIVLAALVVFTRCPEHTAQSPQSRPEVGVLSTQASPSRTWSTWASAAATLGRSS